jgi:holin-like protein
MEGQRMLIGLCALLVFQLVGELLVRGLGLPFPGPVMGMALLFIALVVRGRTPESIRTAGSGLLQHFMLLLIPATAAITLHLSRVRDEWVPILLAGVGGTVLTLAATAATLRLMTAHRAADRS